jgi:hypothetical protein
VRTEIAPVLTMTTAAAGSSLAVLTNRHFPLPTRTISSSEAQITKDHFIECHCRGADIAFCGARIAAKANNALFDAVYLMGRERASFVVEK